MRTLSTLVLTALGIFTLVAFAPPASVLAQTGSITGQVFDRATGEALPGANVRIAGTGLGAATDVTNGTYTIPRVSAGSHELLVTYLGYEEELRLVEVIAGQTIREDFYLSFGTHEGEEIVITAQAAGQTSAINQQLASPTITNIVSADRIRELPDVNAAESIGRLPGVSIHRSGGEATQVSIRGLSPRYNTVTVNGVRVPSTGADDRSVDLGMISSGMLGGIEVRKALTPDMDADAVGGAIDLRLRTAPEGLAASASLQGGYNQLQDYYGNYAINASVSNRFLDNSFGVILSFNTDRYNRSADKFEGNYRSVRPINSPDSSTLVINDILLREEIIKRNRLGGSIVADYQIPRGQFILNTFYNYLNWDDFHRVNRMDPNDSRHYYDIFDNAGNRSIFTGSIGVEQNFGWIKYDASVAMTGTRTSAPREYEYHFIQESQAFADSLLVTSDTHPNELPGYATNLLHRTALESLFINDTQREENEYSFQFNAELPFTFSDLIAGYVKTGGRFRWMDRYNDEDQFGRSGLQYGNTSGPNAALTCLSGLFPDLNITEIVNQLGYLTIESFLLDYQRNDFLNGEYDLGYVGDHTILRQLTDGLRDNCADLWLNMSIASRARDYEGIERYQAGYIMAEINIGPQVTIIPGIRVENDFSRYRGQRLREVVINNVEATPQDLDTLIVERSNTYWLPALHLQYRPTDWLHIRLARTESLIRPDFMHYAPITTINSFQNYIRAANSTLRSAHSINYDASVSVYQSYVGLFTVSVFTKTVHDLIMGVNYPIRPGIPLLDGLNIPENWITNASGQPVTVRYGADTHINNPYPAKYTGIEFDWQTHLWYLPRPIDGIVLNLNYTTITSEIEYRQFSLEQILINPFPPILRDSLVIGSRIARMPDQPTHIFNATLGYDFRGFSGRLSFLYQTDRITSLGNLLIEDGYSGDQFRWDLSLQQRLGYGLQLFTNFNHLSGRPDRNFTGSLERRPAYIEYYGFTMDLGIRYTL